MIDRYTKAVLTVIAVSLSVIALRGSPLVSPVNAQDGPVHVVVDEVEQFAFQFVTVPVRIKP